MNTKVVEENREWKKVNFEQLGRNISVTGHYVSTYRESLSLETPNYCL